MREKYEFDAVIREEEDGGAYVVFPWNIREEFGRGRVKIRAEFDGIPYEGSIVNMGLTDGNGNVLYLIGVRKSIRKALGKADGDTVRVSVAPMQTGCGRTREAACT